MRDTLLRVMPSGIAIIVTLVAARLNRLSFQDDLGLRFPSWEEGSFWLVAFVALVSLEEISWKALSLPEPAPWGSKYVGAIRAVRVFAIILLAPLSEELLFRGLLYHMIARTRLGEVGAIVVTSVAFTGFHFQYAPKEMSFILADGLFFGTARYWTGSTILTIILHTLGNSYAAYQRLKGK